MNTNNNSWYATIDGKELVDIEWCRLSEIREKKLKRVTNDNFIKRIYRNWMK